MSAPTRILFAITLIAGLLSVVPPGEVAQASTAAVQLTPTDGGVGSRVKVEGSGFGTRRSGTVRFGGAQVGSFKTTRSGTFSVTITVPDVPAGSHTVTGQTSVATASAPFTVTTSAPAPAPSDPVRSLFGPAPAFGVALPSNGASDAEFATVTSLVGEAPSIELWYRSFTQELRASELDAVAARGALPYLTWEPWDWRKGVDQPDFRLARIADGTYDAYLVRSARTLRDWKRPVLLRFAHEMNGNWYPWSEAVNGNQPGDYVRAWNRVQDVFRAEGATNVVWVWSPNVEYHGSLPLARLYPGQDRVDLIAVDGYNFGTSQSWSSWIRPAALFDPTFATVRGLAPGKPLLLGEVGSSELGGDKAAWNRELLAWTAAQPDLVGFVWFHLKKETDWRIDSSRASATAFREGLAALR
jgi:hypothetical protein